MNTDMVWDRIQLEQGDITKYKVDAIVNAANTQLRGGGGVDGAIHRAAGPQLLQACRALGGCPTGNAKITDAFNLPARYVIHAVGPIYQDGRSGEEDLLASAYESSFQLAADHDCRTIALPAISCGVYGYPLAAAADIALTTARRFLADHHRPETATWVLFTPEILEVFTRSKAQLQRTS